MLPFYISSCISLGLTLAAIMAVRSDYNNRKVLTNSTTVLVWIAYLFHAGVVLWAAAFNAWALSLSNWLTIPAGTILILIGITITTIAILNFRTFQRMSGLQTDKLITDGIYAWSRNPQNLGWGLALFGLAIIGRSGLALLLSALFGLAVHLYIVVLEEPYLENIYGEPYRKYRAKTARYFGILAGG
jgi:protein-S-isoprenylcysteine O-methyltransferase Ste14